ncbi:MAG: FtsX-like permease family protein [Muribaculaceae bacterium]|nr:FtsX-like permease family protein [Muribaculaceae bacterium]
MNYSLFLARRLSLSADGKRMSPAIGVAIAAVALSVAVMIASICIVGGFKREIRDKVVGFNSHLTLTAYQTEYQEDNLISLTPSMRKLLDDTDFITSYSLEAAMPAVLKTGTDFKGVYFKALDGADERAFIRKNLVAGTVPAFTDALPTDSMMKVVMSEQAARQLELKAGDRIDVYFISDGIKVRRMDIEGVYNTHFESYDNLYLYGSKKVIDELTGIGSDKGTTLHIATDDFDRVEEYAARLSEKLNTAYADGLIYRPYRVETALDRGRNYFSWLSLLDTNVAVVLALMTVVACITLISGLLIIILDKISFVGTMKALGASDRSLGRTFIYVALKVTAFGIIIGNLLMLGLMWIQHTTHFMPLNPEHYYIDFVPVEFNWPAIAVLNAGVLAVVWLALILPSRFVARISPSESMRYE